jgi:hypothetical protein
MSKESIRSLLEAKGTFPDKEDVRAGFEALFALADGRQDSVADLAWGFDVALDQWSQVASVVEPSVAQRLREWVLANWMVDSVEACALLGGLLVNVPSPEVLAFLRQQHAQCTNADIRAELEELIADIEYDDGPGAG